MVVSARSCSSSHLRNSVIFHITVAFLLSQNFIHQLAGRRLALWRLLFVERGQLVGRGRVVSGVQAKVVTAAALAPIAGLGVIFVIPERIFFVDLPKTFPAALIALLPIDVAAADRAARLVVVVRVGAQGVTQVARHSGSNA